VGGLQKRLGAWGRGRKMRGCGRVHDGERERFWGGGRFRHAGPTEQRERRANGRSVLTSGAHGTEREGDTRARGVGADSSAPPGSKSGRGMALIGGGHLS
jgi:hypothetical protein